jgi:hypothetical protein
MMKKKPYNVIEYARSIAKLMGLGEWTLVLDSGLACEDCLAEIDAIYGQRLAKLALCKQLDTIDPETQRATIVHELLHVHLAHYSQLGYDMLNALENGSSKAGTAALVLCEEYVVDAIALAWAPFLPLPGGAV